MTDKILIDRTVVEQTIEAMWQSGEQLGSTATEFNAIEALRVALEQAQGGQEPVAEITGMDEYGPMLGWHKHWVEFPIGAQLYTRPQPRQPLTDEEITEITFKLLNEGASMHDFARAIERAHGIVGE